MTEKAGLPLILLVVLLIFSLSIAGFGFYLLKEERTKNFALQNKLEEVSLSLKRAEEGLSEYKKKSADLEGRLKTAQENIEGLNNQIQQERMSKQESESKLETFRQDLEQQKGLRSELERKLSQEQEDAIKAQARLKELENKKAELEARIAELEKQSQGAPEAQGVELGKIVVSPETSAAVSAGEAERTKEPSAKTKDKKVKKTNDTQVKPEKKKALSPKKKEDKAIVSRPEAKVLVVNKEYGFVVIGLGSKNNIALGDIFAIYHADRHIGDVKVEKLEEYMCAAGFLSSNIKNKVSKDDKAIKKEK